MMKILITTPFFSNLGGSELETIFTANYYSRQKNVSSVWIYVEADYNLSFLQDIYINDKIRIFKKPKFLRNFLVKKVDKKIIKLLNLELSIIDRFFWFFILKKKFKTIYILTKTTLFYHLPIIKFTKSTEKINIKYTTILYNSISPSHLKYIKTVNNIVTSDKQRNFFQSKLLIYKVVCLETLIFNEKHLLSYKPEKLEPKFDFGILGRVSKEKQIEDTIYLIHNLKISHNTKATLLIRGAGVDQNYRDSLNDLIKTLNLSSQIVFENENVPYDKVDSFFQRIKIALVTSQYESGPTVAIEAMAFGIPVLSYDVGAMKDRLIKFPFLICENETDFSYKALKILTKNTSEYIKLCNEVKNHYRTRLSNKQTEYFLKNTLN